MTFVTHSFAVLLIGLLTTADVDPVFFSNTEGKTKTKTEPESDPPPESSILPWSESALSLHVSQNVNKNQFHTYWRPLTGFAFYWAMPFYFGEIEAEIGYYPFAAHTRSQPDFTMVTTALFWGVRRYPAERVSIAGGFQFGMGYMRFGSDSPFDSLESEFFIAPAVNLRYHIHPNWYLTVRAQHKRVFTYHRLDLSYIGFGAGRQFRTPQRLRNFLK